MDAGANGSPRPSVAALAAASAAFFRAARDEDALRDDNVRSLVRRRKKHHSLQHVVACPRRPWRSASGTHSFAFQRARVHGADGR